MKKYISIIISISISTAAVLLTGCETTGDPRAGGLFGWSETKAVERRDALVSQEQQERSSLEASRARQRELQARERSLDSQLAAQQAKLAKMQQELADIKKICGGRYVAEISSMNALIARINGANEPRPVLMAQAESELRALRSKANSLKNT